jgi:hypothetical protein
MPSTISCPSCRRSLRLPEEYIGRQVQCPGCRHAFAAAADPAPVAAPADLPPVADAPPVAAPAELPPAAKAQPVPQEEPPPRRPRYEDDEPERPRRRRRPRYADDAEPCPYCGEPLSLDADYCPNCKHDLAEEYEVDYRPWEEEGEVRRDCDPHRGGVVLTLGIAGLVLAVPTFCCPVVALAGVGMSVAAWILGHGDLRRMRRGVVDPDGRGSTQAGMICGIIGTIIGVLCALPVSIMWGFALFQ